MSERDRDILEDIRDDMRAIRRLLEKTISTEAQLLANKLASDRQNLSAAIDAAKETKK